MMLRSQYFIPTVKETPAEAQVVSHRLMLRAGMIRQLTSGVYSWLPLGLRVLRRVEDIVRDEMNASGALEIHMPMVQPAGLWEETGRYEKYGPELLRFVDRHEHRSVLGPTHEEVVTDIYRKNVRSYRDLPLNLYQIQTKFRDEIRPRFGLMRGREFVMKDAYSFDVDKERSLEAYEKMFAAYVRIFNRLGLAWRSVVADTGSIGGNYSHEFHVLAETGEDDLLFDPESDYAVNVEKYDPAEAPKPREQLEQRKGIEVGHCFHLGTLYSEPMGATVTLDSGQDTPVVMGCYGIGVSRIVAAAIEQNHDDKGIIWPAAMAPFQVGLLNLRREDKPCREACDKIYAQLTAQGRDVLYDERDLSPGAKFAEMDLIGLPWQCIIGPKSVAKGLAEWKNRRTGEIQELELGQLPDFT
jgi:prolyl-tRNA synthetase